MSDLTRKSCLSPNCAFLVQYDEVLVHHAALAERYVFEDPNSTLIKLRQFAEILARHAAAYTSRPGLSSHPRTRMRRKANFVPSLNVYAKRWSPRKSKWPGPNSWSKTMLGSVKRPRPLHNVRITI
jgi:hypothetical protein